MAVVKIAWVVRRFADSEETLTYTWDVPETDVLDAAALVYEFTVGKLLAVYIYGSRWLWRCPGSNGDWG